jgi:imidazoleglycerol phosphate dehydratase HisB
MTTQSDLPNIYRFSMLLPCPMDGALIEYDVEMSARELIMVEDLHAFVGHLAPMLQEELADALHRRWGHAFCRVSITGTHQGVLIKTVRW